MIWLIIAGVIIILSGVIVYLTDPIPGISSFIFGALIGGFASIVICGVGLYHAVKYDIYVNDNIIAKNVYIDKSHNMLFYSPYYNDKYAEKHIPLDNVRLKYHLEWW